MALTLSRKWAIPTIVLVPSAQQQTAGARWGNRYRLPSSSWNLAQAFVNKHGSGIGVGGADWLLRFKSLIVRRLR